MSAARQIGPVEAVPGARLRVREGHAFMAHKTDPDLVAGLIREFNSS